VKRAKLRSSSDRLLFVLTVITVAVTSFYFCKYLKLFVLFQGPKLRFEPSAATTMRRRCSALCHIKIYLFTIVTAVVSVYVLFTGKAQVLTDCRVKVRAVTELFRRHV